MYQLNDAIAIHNPQIFRPFMNYKRWVGAFARYLSSITTGPFSAFFNGCRGAVRSRHELAQFLLPQMIIDIISANVGTGKAAPAAAVDVEDGQQVD